MYRGEAVRLIAHGGGEIDGIISPNCVEAVLLSIDNGIKYIELDLQLTSDSQLVMLHDWKRFHTYTSHQGDSLPITLEELKERKIMGKYTPVTGEWLDSLIRNNDSIVLVTDKISNPRLINKWFSPYRNRVLVECFDISDYIELEAQGYACMLSGSIMPNRRPWSRKAAYYMRKAGLYVPNAYSFFIGKEYKPQEEGLRMRIKRRILYWTREGDWFAVWGVTDKEDAVRVGRLNPRIRYVYIDKTYN